MNAVSGKKNFRREETPFSLAQQTTEEIRLCREPGMLERLCPEQKGGGEVCLSLNRRGRSATGYREKKRWIGFRSVATRRASFWGKKETASP